MTRSTIKYSFAMLSVFLVAAAVGHETYGYVVLVSNYRDNVPNPPEPEPPNRGGGHALMVRDPPKSKCDSTYREVTDPNCPDQQITFTVDADCKVTACEAVIPASPPERPNATPVENSVCCRDLLNSSKEPAKVTHRWEMKTNKPIPNPPGRPH